VALRYNERACRDQEQNANSLHEGFHYLPDFCGARASALKSLLLTRTA